MPIEDPTDKERLSEALANTYQTTADVTPWELCQQYQRMLEYTAANPDAGRYKVANAIGEEVPPGRVRPWLNGGRPDAMHGIQACEAHGWLDLTWGGPTFHNLAILVAWIFSGGSITVDWVPYLAVDDYTHATALDLLRALDEEPDTVRAETKHRATEVRPTTDPSALGRLLTVLGAPQGPKHSHSRISLPPWLRSAPRDVQLAFARTYVVNRGTPRDDRPMTPLQIREQRPLAYRRSLRSFLDSVASTDVTRGDSENIRLTAAGADLFNQLPTIVKQRGNPGL